MHGEAEGAGLLQSKQDKAPGRDVYNHLGMGGCKRLSGFPLEDYRNRARDNSHKLSTEGFSWIMNNKNPTKLQ